MSRIVVEVGDEQLEQLVIDELKLALELNLVMDYDEGGEPMGRDEILIASLDNVLKYFMTHSDYEEYMSQFKDKEQ